MSIIQDYQNKAGCQYVRYFYYSEDLNWSALNHRLGRGLDIAGLDVNDTCKQGPSLKGGRRYMSTNCWTWGTQYLLSPIYFV